MPSKPDIDMVSGTIAAINMDDNKIAADHHGSAQRQQPQRRSIRPSSAANDGSVASSRSGEFSRASNMPHCAGSRLREVLVRRLSKDGIEARGRSNSVSGVRYTSCWACGRQRRACSSTIHVEISFSRRCSGFIPSHILRPGLPGGVMRGARRARRRVRWGWGWGHRAEQFLAAPHHQRSRRRQHGAGTSRCILTARNRRECRDGQELGGTVPRRAHRRSDIHRPHLHLHAPDMHHQWF